MYVQVLLISRYEIFSDILPDFGIFEIIILPYIKWGFGYLPVDEVLNVN